MTSGHEVLDCIQYERNISQLAVRIKGSFCKTNSSFLASSCLLEHFIMCFRFALPARYTRIV
ncbi:hypothetical protein OIU77_019995 [Salix suchowensis]|uniref:Uncharacterized protein n=1 Tax=Salix suchowensis TaxID=1278906 RepID=A0ABQ9CLR5_9ROSI|nr:hypothetical protein OIU77_019995 [Salix suchowensis]KAJ6399358.1 hypothetical protein OIU77_019995 [Salix suchowensis]KAJ6399359.1 hypothetical protein OIU77_019995 [Salix suchowensis]